MAYSRNPSATRPASPHYEDQNVKDIVNDVEMQSVSESPASTAVYIVVDTNILLHFCALLESFIHDIERWDLAIKIVVPGVVVDELDRQKTRHRNPNTSLLARFASRWLLDHIRRKKAVKGQAYKETMKTSKNWRVADPGEDTHSGRYNDSLVLDCCHYYARMPGAKAILFCHDNNLCTNSESDGIPSVTPGNNWSSQDIAEKLYMYMGYSQAWHTERDRFSHVSPDGYRGLEYVRGFERGSAPARADDNDMMEVDDDLTLQAPTHALDVLHIEVASYFTQLLREAAYRLDQKFVAEDSYSTSMHGRRRPPNIDRVLTSWFADECIAFVDGQTRTSGIPPDVMSKLRSFMCKDRGSKKGWRRGQDWPKSEWHICLDALGTFAKAHQDQPLLLSLDALKPHVDGVFSLGLRPTGT